MGQMGQSQLTQGIAPEQRCLSEEPCVGQE